MKRILSREKLPGVLLWLAFAALCVVISGKKYYALVLCLIGIYTIALTGLDILFGYSGQISFGHAGFYTIGAYTSAVLTKTFGWRPLAAMLVSAVLAVAVAVVIAIPACRLRKHFLAVLTTTFSQIIVLLATNMQLTGAATGISSIPRMQLFGIVLDTRRKSLVFIAVLAILGLALKRKIVHSRIGRAFLAIKGNTAAAQGLGINVRFYKTLAFAICAFYGAVAGSLYAHLVRFISPESFEGTQSTLFITTLLLGGLQSDYGALIGSLVILPMKEMLQQFADYQGIAFALLSIMALFFFPRGLYGLIGQLRGLAGKRLRGKPAAAAPGTEAGAAGPRGRER